MDYKELSNAVKLCGSTPKVDQCKACPYWAEGDMSKCIQKMTKDAADAITDLMKYKDAIDRMGRFGNLFVKYSGDPRGPMGTMFLPALADKEIEYVLMMKPIEDVEGDKWRPVGEGWLQQLIERTKAAEAERDAYKWDLEFYREGCHRLSLELNEYEKGE